jgi:hypothetical protein
MAEVLVQFDPPVTDEGGRTYVVRICGRPAEDGLWEGWIEFDPVDGAGTLRTPRETEQPHRKDLEYWAEGVTLPYLEGALERARHPETPDLRPRQVDAHPAYDRPAPSTVERVSTGEGTSTVAGTSTVVSGGLAAQLPAFAPGGVEPTAGARARPRAALNPYRVYSRQGENELREQLLALDEGELRNVIEGYKLLEGEVGLDALDRFAMAEMAVAAVRKLYGG